eukprot:scpid55297/ scgid15519/ 
MTQDVLKQHTHPSTNRNFYWTEQQQQQQQKQFEYRNLQAVGVTNPKHQHNQGRTQSGGHGDECSKHRCKLFARYTFSTSARVWKQRRCVYNTYLPLFQTIPTTQCLVCLAMVDRQCVLQLCQSFRTHAWDERERERERCADAHLDE